MKRVILIAFISLFSQFSIGQTKLIIEGKTSIGRTIVHLKSDTSEIESTTSRLRGKYRIEELKLGSIYKLYFSKPGYVTKFIEIDLTKGSVVYNVTYFDLPMKMDLVIEYSTTDIFKEPVARLMIDNNGELSMDLSYTYSQRLKIDHFRKNN